MNVSELLKKYKFLPTRLITARGPVIYNTARAIVCLSDKIKIKWAAKKNKPFILIYQQGRVASTSVYESIKAMKLPYPLYHVHTLSIENAEQKIKLAKKNNTKAYRHFFVGKYLGKAIQNIKLTPSYEPWKVICIFRDPIDIMLSLYFLNIETKSKDLELYEDKEAALEYFQNLFESNDPSGWAICRWFDDVFYKELGIDVYSHAFDTEKGFVVIKTEKFEILLLRFENLASVYKHGSAELLGIDSGDFNLMHANIHRNDKYSDMHIYIKKNLRLSKSFCDKVYTTKLMKHFYSSAMIETSVKKWTKVK